MSKKFAEVFLSNLQFYPILQWIHNTAQLYVQYIVTITILTEVESQNILLQILNTHIHIIRTNT